MLTSSLTVAFLSTAAFVDASFIKSRHPKAAITPPHPMSERDLGIYGDWKAAGPTDIGLGVGPTISATAGAKSFLGMPLGKELFLDLDVLNTHGLIEHDVSLTRQNVGQGDNSRFNNTMFTELLDFVPSGATHWGYSQTAKSHHKALKKAQTQGPSFGYGVGQALAGHLELGFIHTVMTGNGVIGDVPLPYLKSFFVDERIPYAEGFRAPLIPVEAPNLFIAAAAILANNPDPLNEALAVGAASVVDTLNLSNPFAPFLPGIQSLDPLFAAFGFNGQKGTHKAPAGVETYLSPLDDKSTKQVAKLIHSDVKSTHEMEVPEAMKAGLNKILSGVYGQAGVVQPSASTTATTTMASGAVVAPATSAASSATASTTSSQPFSLSSWFSSWFH
ncbi:hypothetical protein RQP46_007962 [Phenoliferia psychrophenolica]